jgi:hypothetical protein
MRILFSIFVSLVVRNGFSQSNTLHFYAGLVAQVIIREQKALLNDTTFVGFDINNEPGLFAGASISFPLDKRVEVFVDLSGQSIFPSAPIRMGQTYQSGNGPMIVYSSWVPAFSYFMLKGGVGITYNVNHFLSLSGGGGVGYKFETGRPASFENANKFREVAKSVDTIVKKTNAYYGGSINLSLKKFVLAVGYQRSYKSETRPFQYSNRVFYLPVHLGFTNITLGYKIELRKPSSR